LTAHETPVYDATTLPERGAIAMSEPNERDKISDALPVQEAAAARKRRCPACGGDDLMKLWWDRHQQNFEYTGLGLGVSMRSEFGVTFQLKDLQVCDKYLGDLHPNLHVCLSCGFMAWYIAPDEREWLREVRVRVRQEMA
jgi:hypothetical protein